MDPVYQKVKKEVLGSRIILADETPHKMLEGDNTKNWYLWGFNSKEACFFEARGTRSGDVPLEFLQDSVAEYLVTDGYSGYKRALSELKPEINISEIYCNAHAIRYFKEASNTWENESRRYLEIYEKIYDLERICKSDEERKIARKKMVPLFKKLKNICQEGGNDVMAHSSLEKAVNYFLNHYPGLTKCLEDIEIPLDNNFNERLMRSPVVGRKTWIGTHSKRGAHTNSVLFSLVETCKINRINPRHYFPWIVDQIHKKNRILTPHEFSQIDSG